MSKSSRCIKCTPETAEPLGVSPPEAVDLLLIKANDLAASIPASDRKEMRIGNKRQWYFTVTVRVPT